MNSKDEKLLKTYKTMLEMPVIKNPDYIHESTQILRLGSQLRPNFRNSWKDNKYIAEIEELFESVRHELFPHIPSRYESVFLWSKREMLTKYILPKPDMKRIHKIKDILEMRQMPFVVSVDENAALFYADIFEISTIIEEIYNYNLSQNK